MLPEIAENHSSKGEFYARLSYFHLFQISCQVTGGSAGIGRAAALAFGQNGARVAIMGRRKERLDVVLADLPEVIALVVLQVS